MWEDTGFGSSDDHDQDHDDGDDAILESLHGLNTEIDEVDRLIEGLEAWVLAWEGDCSFDGGGARLIEKEEEEEDDNNKDKDDDAISTTTKTPPHLSSITRTKTRSTTRTMKELAKQTHTQMEIEMEEPGREQRRRRAFLHPELKRRAGSRQLRGVVGGGGWGGRH